MNQQETIDKVKVALTNLNAILQECRKQDISVAIDVNYEDNKQHTIYLHKNNKTLFEIREIYK